MTGPLIAEREPGPPRRLLFVLAGIITAAYVLWVWRSGVRIAVDTATFSGWADLLIANDFNVSSYLRENRFITPPVLYLAWIYIVAILKTTVGSSWMGGVIVLNLVALSVGVYLALRSVRHTTQSWAGLLLATALFLVAGDLIIFVPFVLSDLMFWALSTAVVTLGITVLVDERRLESLRWPFVTGSALVVVACVFRPTAAPLVALWSLAVLGRGMRAIVIRRGPGLLGVAAVLATLPIAVHAYLLIDPSAWPVGAFPATMKLLAEEYRSGVLVYAPGANLLVAPAVDWPGAIRLTLQKWMYFWTPLLPFYSAAHSAINVAFFVPVYGLSVAALVNFRGLTPRQQLSAWLLVNFALLVSVFHAMMQIEYDHRYRLPLLPALIMLAAIGFESLRRPRRSA